MSCSSAICMVNASRPDISANAQIPFGGVVRRFGKNVVAESGNIVLRGEGYYDVDISISVSSATAGDVSAQLYQDGIALPGATATDTIAAADDFANLKIPYLVRNCGCNCNTVLSVSIDSAVTLDNMVTVVKKV